MKKMNFVLMALVFVAAVSSQFAFAADTYDQCPAPPTKVWTCTMPDSVLSTCAPDQLSEDNSTSGYSHAEALRAQINYWVNYPICSEAVNAGMAVCKELL